MPLDEKLAYIYMYAHGAEAMDQYCEAPHVPDLEQRLVSSLALGFAPLRSFRLLHNAPPELEPNHADGTQSNGQCRVRIWWKQHWVRRGTVCIVGRYAHDRLWVGEVEHPRRAVTT